MNAPFHAHMAKRHRSPRPFNSLPRHFNGQPRPYDNRSYSGFQWRPHTNFGSIKNSTTESNEEHWCETCDRGFPTGDMLDRHKQQHQKCNIDGCQFVAHPKVITKHIQMQHSSGLYKKISKLDNPEEIKKWREERKKKYPTRINIEKKEAEYKEKIERGEKMALKKNLNQINQISDHPSARNRSHIFNKNNQHHKVIKPNINKPQRIASNKDQPPPKKVKKVLPNIPSVIGKNKLKPFSGILSISIDDDPPEDVCNLSNSNNSLIEEDEYTENVSEKPIEKVIQEPVLCGALTSLMCDYGSSDEEVAGQENNKATITNIVQARQPLNIERLQHIEANYSNIKEETINDNLANDLDKTEDNSDNDSGPEEVKTVKMNNAEPTYSEIPKTKKLPVNSKKSFIPRSNHRHYNKYKQKVPSTLLQKLLYKEIRQERNIVLQCIRYVKKMNYFDKLHE